MFIKINGTIERMSQEGFYDIMKRGFLGFKTGFCVWYAPSITVKEVNENKFDNKPFFEKSTFLAGFSIGSILCTLNPYTVLPGIVTSLSYEVGKEYVSMRKQKIIDQNGALSHSDTDLEGRLSE